MEGHTLEFSKENIAGIAVVEKHLTEYDIEVIMVGAIEGGIGYWAILDNVGELWDEKPRGVPVSQWATHLLLHGHEIQFFDTEDPDEPYPPLTLEKLIKGYAQNVKERPFDSDIYNGDVVTCDCIVQYAIFEDVVYG